MGTRGNAKKGRSKERWIDGVRRSMTDHGLTIEDTRDRDGETSFWLKGNHCRVDKPLDDDDDDLQSY
jgi:hypothetical protein